MEKEIYNGILNHIYEGDAMKLSMDLPDNFVDLVITSPPYANTKSYGKSVNTVKPDEFSDWILPLFQEAERFLKGSGSFILNINDRVVNGERSTYVYETIINIVKNTNLKLFDRYIWYKQNGLPMTGNKRLNDRTEYIFHFVKDVKKFKSFTDRMRVPYKDITLKRLEYNVRSVYKVDDDGITSKSKGNKRLPNPLGTKPINVFEFPTACVLRDNKHAAPFHPDLPTFFIKWLTDEDDVVMDPFMGGGTTAISAMKLNRNYIGYEINKKYVDDIINPRIKEAKSSLKKSL